MPARTRGSPAAVTMSIFSPHRAPAVHARARTAGRAE